MGEIFCNEWPKAFLAVHEALDEAVKALEYLYV